MPNIKKDLRDQRFGKLKTVDSVRKNTQGSIVWLCNCDCGNVAYVSQANLHAGNVRSCGCLRKARRTDGTPLSRIYSDYRDRARRKTLVFELTKERFAYLIKGLCDYCGATPSNSKKCKNHEPFLYNGIDRVKNEEGYTYTNSVTCCSICNIAKGALSTKDFLNHIKNICRFSDLH